MKNEEKKEEWRVREYDARKNCDILDYYVNGILQFTFDGYRNERAGTWRVYPRAAGIRGTQMPNVKTVCYHEAKRA